MSTFIVSTPDEDATDSEINAILENHYDSVTVADADELTELRHQVATVKTIAQRLHEDYIRERGPHYRYEASEITDRLDDLAHELDQAIS